MTSQLICAGLSFENEAELRAGERARLKLWIERKRRRAAVDVAVAMIPVAAFGATHFKQHIALQLVVLAGVLLTPLFLLDAVSQTLGARKYTKALAHGRVQRFARVAPQHEPLFTDALQEVLVRRVLKGVGPSDLLSLSILPQTREVLAVNDTFATPGLIAEAVKVAAPPTSTWQLPLPPGVVVDASVAEDAKRRQLSPSEIEELKEKVRLLRRLSVGYWVLTGLTVTVFLLWRSDGYPIPPKVPTQILPPALWLFTMFQVARNWRNAARLLRDIELGWTLRLERLKQPGIPEVRSCEVLPASNSLWTVEGVPAAWRGAKSFHTLLIDRR